MEKQLDVLLNELYKVIAGIRECKRFNKLEPSGNGTKVLLQLNNVVQYIQQFHHESSMFNYRQVDALIDMLQSAEWLAAGLWPTTLTALTNILKQPASCTIIDKSFSALLAVDVIAFEHKLEGIASEYMHSLTQILAGDCSNNVNPNTICQAYLKMFHLSLQNKHATIRLHALNTFTHLITRHHLQNFQLPLLLSAIISLDWLARIRNEPNNERLHITSIKTLEALQIYKFDYHAVVKLYATNVTSLAALSRGIMPTAFSNSFLDRLSALVVAALNSVNEFLELRIHTLGNSAKICKQSLKFVLINHLSFALFVSFLWENEGVLEAAIRCMFNLHKIFGMEISKQLEFLISQLFSNALNANKDYNAYLLRRIFLAISVRDIHHYMDACPHRHNTYQALVKLLLSNCIPNFRGDARALGLSKRKNVFSQARARARERSARSDDAGSMAEGISSDVFSHTLSALSALLAAISFPRSSGGCLAGVEMGTEMTETETADNVTLEQLVEKFNSDGEWLSHFDGDETKVAHFLMCPFLDLKKAGEFLGSHVEPVFMDKVRREFVAQFNFTAMPIITALRKFLATFRLPGESQQIERIIDTFAETYFAHQLEWSAPEAALCDAENATPRSEGCLMHYRWVVHEEVYYETFRDESFLSALRAYYSPPPSAQCIDSNRVELAPDRTMSTCADVLGPYVWRKSFESGLGAWFANADAVFVLCYSIIMLNTDLHNSHIRNKMKLEEFIRNNKGINAGDDLPDAFLCDIYKSISRSQIQLYRDHAGSIQPTMDSFNTNYSARKVDMLQLPLLQYRQFWSKVDDGEILIGIEAESGREDRAEEVLDSGAIGSSAPCLGILVSAGVLEFLDSAVYLSESAEFLQETLTTLWKLSVIAAKFDAVDLVNEIFTLPSLTFTDQLSHRCQIIVAFSMHFVAAFGKLFDAKSWEVAYSAQLSLLSLNLLQNSTFGMPSPCSSPGGALVPPKVKFHRADLRRQGFKWISDIAGYIFSNKHTAAEPVAPAADVYSAPRFGREALGKASMHFLFSPQNRNDLISNPLFDPLLAAAEVELIRSTEDELCLRQLLDMFYQYGSGLPSASKASRTVDCSQRPPIAAMLNLSTLPDASLPQLLDYFKFRLALINHYKVHLLVPAVLCSHDCKLPQFDSGLGEIERWLFNQWPRSAQGALGSGMDTMGNGKGGRRLEREEDDSDRCKRGVILAPNEKELSRFRIRASPLVALATLGLLVEAIAEAGEAETAPPAAKELVAVKLDRALALFARVVYSIFDSELLDVTNVSVANSGTEEEKPSAIGDVGSAASLDCTALNWLAGDDLDSIKACAVAIVLGFVSRSIGGVGSGLRRLCGEMLFLISRLPCKYLSLHWMKAPLHAAIAAAAGGVSSNSGGFLPALLLIQRICGMGDLTIVHHHDRRSCVTEEHSVWRIFNRLIANSGFSRGEHRDHLADVVQTIIVIAVFYQKCPPLEEEYGDQVEAVKLLVGLAEGGAFGGERGIVMRSLALISAFAPKAVRAGAMVNLQHRLCHPGHDLSLNDFFSLLDGVVIPLVTYRWTYRYTYTLDVGGECASLPLFHEHLAASLSTESAAKFLSDEGIAARMASSFSTLCQTFMASLSLLLAARDNPPMSVGHSMEELTKCGENCIGYLLLAVRMVLKSLAEPSARVIPLLSRSLTERAPRHL